VLPCIVRPLWCVVCSVVLWVALCNPWPVDGFVNSKSGSSEPTV
jgi:hypothetical protein